MLVDIKLVGLLVPFQKQSSLCVSAKSQNLTPQSPIERATSLIFEELQRLVIPFSSEPRSYISAGTLTEKYFNMQQFVMLKSSSYVLFQGQTLHQYPGCRSELRSSAVPLRIVECGQSCSMTNTSVLKQYQFLFHLCLSSVRALCNKYACQQLQCSTSLCSISIHRGGVFEFFSFTLQSRHCIWNPLYLQELNQDLPLSDLGSLTSFHICNLFYAVYLKCLCAQMRIF